MAYNGGLHILKYGQYRGKSIELKYGILKFMKNWFKDNWFKIAILLIIFWVAWYCVKFLSSPKIDIYDHYIKPGALQGLGL